MAATKLLNLFAISSLAVLAFSSWSSPANALSLDTAHMARHNARAHDAVAMRKRSDGTKRCKVRSPATTPATTPVAKEADPPKTMSSTSSNPPAATTAPPATNSGGKIGLAWPNGDDPALANFKTSHVTDFYSWTPEIPAKAKSLGFNPIPMLWCDNQISDFTRLVVGGYAKAVLGMNEPNESGQCNISPQHGADLWRQYINPLKKQGYQLYSPATSSSPAGKKWMQDFFATCPDCIVDAVAAHYYDVTAQGLIDYMTDFHNTFNRSILITEFACQNFNNGPQCSSNQIFSFMKDVLKFCNDTPWIISCMPFGFMHQMQGVNDLNRLMNSDGTPTALGHLVINGGSES